VISIFSDTKPQIPIPTISAPITGIMFMDNAATPHFVPVGVLFYAILLKIFVAGIERDILYIISLHGHVIMEYGL